jgi:hypothetical protein
METSLHRQLKHRYADRGAKCEVPLGKYRIDVVNRDELVEIQHGSLAAIRDKVRELAADHPILVVKPIIVRKRLVKLDAKGGRVIGRRLSPKRGNQLELFDELVYFTKVFPHKNVRIEAPLVDVEEWRYPGHGKRRRRRECDHQVEDQKLLRVRRIIPIHDSNDLASLINVPLPSPFHTGQLADALDVARWFAQRIAYCLRKMNAIRPVGKRGNTWLYEFIAPPTQAA